MKDRNNSFHLFVNISEIKQEHCLCSEKHKPICSSPLEVLWRDDKLYLEVSKLTW